MTTERKQWWRKVVAVAVGGSVVTGGLLGIARAIERPEKSPVVDNTAWIRPATPTPSAPSVAEVERIGTPTSGVFQVSGTLPIPTPDGVAVAPGLPVVPLIPVPTGLELDAARPRIPDAALIGGDKKMLPTVPPLPALELPKVPAAPGDVKLVVPPGDQQPKLPAPPAMLPMPPVVPTQLAGLPPLPGNTAEPPRAPVVPVPPPPVMPGTPVPPQPVGIAPSLPPYNPANPVQTPPPVKPDSGLNPIIPGNTLYPPSPVAPATPFPFTSPGGRDVPGIPVERAKPTDPAFGSTDKFVFPVPGANDPPSLTPRETAMLNLKHTAALAVIGGAMLTAENARAAALFPPIVPTVPATPVRADDKDVTDKLKKDLETANDKIKALEKQVAKLTELLTGKKDELGIAVPSDPGAVAEIKRLTDQVKALDTELKALKTQTALKPAIVPEVKPKGIVKVVNEYPVEISMVINDKSHRIPPNTKIEVEVPVGDFSYQLLQSGAAATRSVIKDKETVTLRIK